MKVDIKNNTFFFFAHKILFFVSRNVKQHGGRAKSIGLI
jgi:hypothetical protein